MDESSIINLDTEKFISAVQRQPAIWDTSSEYYHDRIRKRSSWLIICEEFFEGFMGKSEREKNEIEKKLIKRWKNIIDNYKKFEKKREKLGKGADSGRRYLYARQLAFLKQTTDPAPTENSVIEEEGYANDENISVDISITEDENDINCTGDSDKIPASKRQRIIEEGLLNFPTVELPDDDKSFFDSIIPAVKTLSMDRKLEFRCEVMRLLIHYRSLESAPFHTALQDSTTQFNSTGPQSSG